MSKVINRSWRWYFLALIGCMGVVSNAFGQVYGVNIADSRSTPTTPDSYANNLVPSFKEGAVIGLADSYYYTLLGLRGWHDNTGGRAFELAFGNDDRIRLRSGYAPVWEGWRTVLSTDVQGDLDMNNGVIKSGDISFGSNQITRTSAKNYVTVGTDAHGSMLLGSNLFVDDTGLKIARDHPTMSGAGILINGNNRPLQNSIQFHTIAPSNAVASNVYKSLRMVISPNGNVGIGLSDPQERLAVNGTVRAREMKVETAGWPDYVFEPGYELVSLDSLEVYVKRFKHLPGVPAAAEVESAGLNLGEMNKVLVKKVEELTLHLMEKHQEIKSLKAKDADRQLILEAFAKRLEVLEARSADQPK